MCVAREKRSTSKLYHNLDKVAEKPPLDEGEQKSTTARKTLLGSARRDLSNKFETVSATLVVK